MAYTTIDNPAEYFNTKLYTGTGATNSLTGVGFQPDWVWIKGRSGATDHGLYDAVRGVQNQLESNTTTAETTEATGLTAFGTDGFTVGALAQLNTSAATYVAWNWKANGAGVSNTSGTISSTVSANTTAGFSIVSYTGNSTSGATVGHGLSSAPKVVFGKARNTAGEDWFFGTSSIGFTKYLKLNTTDAENTFSGAFNDTAPSSTVVTLGNNGIVNSSSFNYIMYCFAEIKGYSKFGSYTGNGNANGTFVYTGFKPAFVLAKVTSTTDNWNLIDNKRDPSNEGSELVLFPNLSDADTAATRFDMLSNGFKCRTTNVSVNSSGATYIYMAFAENPFVSSTGIPTTAR